MLQFKQSDTAAELILTLSERVTINDPYFLFVFTHVTTKQVISLVRYIGADESSFQGRYNQFTINPTVVFAGTPIGEWHYAVYEQVSNSNIDPEASGALLEVGKLKLDRAVAYTPTMYNQSQSYTVYNG